MVDPFGPDLRPITEIALSCAAFQRVLSFPRRRFAHFGPVSHPRRSTLNRLIGPRIDWRWLYLARRAFHRCNRPARNDTAP